MSGQSSETSSHSPANPADRAARRRSITITVEGVGSVHLPPAEDLAFLAGIGLIAAAGLIDWPVAGVVAAGHLIARAGHNKALQEFGEALETA